MRYEPYRDADINPVGFNLDITYNFELNKYNPDGNYTIEEGILKPQYDNFNFHRLELNSKTSFKLWGENTISTDLRAATIFGPQMPDFFDFYLGGLPGMKAYPFYAISGNRIGWFNLTYRFPLFRDIDSRFGQFYLDKIFMSVYGDFGNAWNGTFPKLKDFKKGAGAEVRIAMTSFYMFPTDVFFNAAYGFDRVTRQVGNETITYGKEWRVYGGVLFSFDF